MVRIRQHTVFQALPPCMRSPENTGKHLIWPVSLSFFGLCDLEISHMTLKILEPQTVCVSDHMIKYQSNRCRNVLAKAGTDGQTDRRTDRQGRLWICLPQLKWHTLQTKTPNKWPKNKRKNLRHGVWAFIVLRRCQTNVLPSYIYQENIIFKWSKEKGDFFRFQRCV